MVVGSSVPEADPGARPSRDTKPVCDPEMPPSFRKWALGQRAIFSARGELAAITPGGSSAGVQPAAVVGWLLAAVCMILLIIDPPSIGRDGWLAVGVAAAAGAVVTRHQSRRRDLWLCRSTVVFPESLDETCRVLLGRAQKAIGVIAGSYVRAAGLLENPVQDEVLSQHEWDIAVELAKITKLRSLHQENARLGPAGPMTTDVLTAHQRAVDLAQEATAARVAALERYAEQVTAADEADRDWRRAAKLSELNDQYLDLVARTASDEHAVREITRLTEQLQAAAQARQDTLRQADLAAAVLALPAPPVPPPRQADPG